MAHEEAMLRLAGSGQKATVTLLRTYQGGKPCTVSSVGKDVEPQTSCCYWWKLACTAESVLAPW